MRTIESDLRATNAELQQTRVALAGADREREKVRVLHEAANEHVRRLELELKTREAALADLRARLADSEAQTLYVTRSLSHFCDLSTSRVLVIAYTKFTAYECMYCKL